MAELGFSRRRIALLVGGMAILGAAPMASARKAPDPFEALAEDHRRVEAVVARMQKTSQNQTGDRVRLLGELKQAIVSHANVEEYVLYPALRQSADSERAARDFFAEHGEVKTLLYELELTPRSDVRWPLKAADLGRLLEAHHRREEEEIFPKYRASLNAVQLEFLSQLAERERGQS